MVKLFIPYIGAPLELSDRGRAVRTPPPPHPPTPILIGGPPNFIKRRQTLCELTLILSYLNRPPPQVAPFQNPISNPVNHLRLEAVAAAEWSRTPHLPPLPLPQRANSDRTMHLLTAPFCYARLYHHCFSCGGHWGITDRLGTL